MSDGSVIVQITTPSPDFIGITPLRSGPSLIPLCGIFTVGPLVKEGK